MSTRRFTGLFLAVPFAVATGTAIGYLAAGAHRRLGVSRAETEQPLPGDEIIESCTVQNDRACTIEAPPDAVWPWIAQLGQGKAGFYSFEGLENLAGCEIQGATKIHPEWQHVEPGDEFRLHPQVSLRVAEVEPGSHLVVTSAGGEAPQGPEFDFSWAFVLSPEARDIGPVATRLHVRERYASHGPTARLMLEATSIISAIMTWRMFQQLTKLVASQ